MIPKAEPFKREKYYFVPGYKKRKSMRHPAKQFSITKKKKKKKMPTSECKNKMKKTTIKNNIYLTTDNTLTKYQELILQI